MSTETPEYKKLSREELEQLAGEALPERAAMSLINANVAAPVNAALALNVLSDSSVAYANAEQVADIDQSNSQRGRGWRREAPPSPFSPVRRSRWARTHRSTRS